VTLRRKRGTGCVTQRGEAYFVAYAPQLGGRGAKQHRIATRPTYQAAALELDAWLNRSGRILRRETVAEKRARTHK
jgi:hypothetical protein